MGQVLGDIVVGEVTEMGSMMRGSFVGMMGSVVLGVVTSEKEFIFFGISSDDVSGDTGEVGGSSVVMVSGVLGQIVVGEMRGSLVSMMGSVVLGVVTSEKEFIFFGIIPSDGSLVGMVSSVVLGSVLSPEEELVFFSIISSDSVVGSSVEVMSSVVLGVVSSPEEEFIIFFSISLDDVSGEVGEMGDLVSLVLQMLSVVNGVMSFVGQIVVSGNEDGNSVDGLGRVGGVSSKEEFIFSIVSSDGVVSSSVEMGESRLNSRLVGQIVMGEMGDGGLVEMGDMVDGSVVGQVVSNRTVNGSEAELFSLNERDSAKSEKAEDNDRSHA